MTKKQTINQLLNAISAIKHRGWTSETESARLAEQIEMYRGRSKAHPNLLAFYNEVMATVSRDGNEIVRQATN